MLPTAHLEPRDAAIVANGRDPGHSLTNRGIFPMTIQRGKRWFRSYAIWIGFRLCKRLQQSPNSTVIENKKCSHEVLRADGRQSRYQKQQEQAARLAVLELARIADESEAEL